VQTTLALNHIKEQVLAITRQYKITMKKNYLAWWVLGLDIDRPLRAWSKPYRLISKPTKKPNG
jgi:hypothetical protein